MICIGFVRSADRCADRFDDSYGFAMISNGFLRFSMFLFNLLIHSDDRFADRFTDSFAGRFADRFDDLYGFAMLFYGFL